MRKSWKDIAGILSEYLSREQLQTAYDDCVKSLDDETLLDHEYATRVHTAKYLAETIAEFDTEQRF